MDVFGYAKEYNAAEEERNSEKTSDFTKTHNQMVKWYDHWEHPIDAGYFMHWE